MLDEAVLQPVDLGVLLRLLGIVLEDEARDPLQQPGERRQQQHRGQTEQRVEQRDADHVHRRRHEGELRHGIDGVEYGGPKRHADHIDQQIHERDALALDAGAEGGQQHRHGRADRDAHDDRQRDAKADLPGDGQRLQNADGGGGALQHAGDQHADQDADDRMLEGAERLDEERALLQRGDGRAHGGHAGHQDGEAHQDVAHLLLQMPLAEHPQDDAHHRDHAGQRGGGHQRHPARRAAVNVGQADDPPGDAGAQDRAQHHADGLPCLHHAGVDEADHHDGGRRGGLDDRRHARAEQDALDRRARQPVQHQLQLVARHAFQACAHQQHTEQEQRHTAQKCDQIRNVHQQNSHRPRSCAPILPIRRALPHFSSLSI